MDDHYDRKRTAQEAVKRLKKDGVMHYSEIAEAAGIEYQSLRQFVHNRNLGPEQTRQLYDWLVDHGHITTSPRVAETPTIYGGQQRDKIAEFINVVEGMLPLATDSDLPAIERLDLVEVNLRALLALVPGTRKVIERETEKQD